MENHMADARAQRNKLVSCIIVYALHGQPELSVIVYCYFFSMRTLSYDRSTALAQVAHITSARSKCFFDPIPSMQVHL